MPLIQRICVPCMVLGSALFLLALEAAAADAGTTSPLLTWRDLALAAVGLIAALVGAFAKGQQSRVDKIETKLDALSLKLVQDHPNETRIKEYIAAGSATVDLRLCSVENSLRAVHRRLDYMRVPAVHNGFHDIDDGN